MIKSSVLAYIQSEPPLPRLHAVFDPRMPECDWWREAIGADHVEIEDRLYIHERVLWYRVVFSELCPRVQARLCRMAVAAKPALSVHQAFCRAIYGEGLMIPAHYICPARTVEAGRLYFATHSPGGEV